MNAEASAPRPRKKAVSRVNLNGKSPDTDIRALDLKR